MQPTRKVSVGVIAGSITTIILWIIDDALGVDVPVEVAGAIVTVMTFLLSYIVPEKDQAE